MEVKEYEVGGREIECIRAEIYCERCDETWEVPEEHRDSFTESHVSNGPCKWSDIGVW